MAAVALVAPLWSGTYLPFQDYPQHVGLAAVLHGYSDPSMGFETFYELDLRPIPYWGFFGPTWILSSLLPVPIAAKVTLSLAVLGLPFGVASVLAAFDRDPLLAIFSLPFIYVFPLFLGFTAFYVAVPIGLFALAAADRLMSRAESRAWPAGVLAMLTYLAHGQIFLLLVAAIGFLAILHRPPVRRLLVFLPAALLLGYWLTSGIVDSSATMSAGHRALLEGRGYGPHVRTFVSPAQSLSDLASYTFDIHGGWRDDVPAMISLALLGAFAITRRPIEARTLRDNVVAWRLELLIAVLLLSYFVLPLRLGYQWCVGQRHAWIVGLLLPALGGPDAFRGWRRHLAPFVAILGLAGPMWLVGAVRYFQKDVAGLDAIAASIPHGPYRTLGLVWEAEGAMRWKSPGLLHAVNYVQTVAGGDIGYSFAGLPNIPVRYREGAQATFPDEWRPDEFDWDVHRASYDRLLAHAAPESFLLEAERRGFHVTTIDGWSLVVLPPRSTLP
jgi:hypothetical protein